MIAAQVPFVLNVIYINVELQPTLKEEMKV